MSIDTYVQLRTPMTAEEVRTALVHHPELADLGLVDLGEEDSLISHPVSVVITPWEEDDRLLIDDGFETGSVQVTTIPRSGAAGDAAYRAEERIIAALLRLMLGDVRLADQNNAGPDLLRLGGTVYVDPDGFRPESLAENGYMPGRLVIGIPPDLPVAA